MQLQPDGLVGVFYYESFCKRVISRFEQDNLESYKNNSGYTSEFGKRTLVEVRNILLKEGSKVKYAYIFDERDATWYVGDLQNGGQLVKINNIRTWQGL